MNVLRSVLEVGVAGAAGAVVAAGDEFVVVSGMVGIAAETAGIAVVEVGE